MAGGHSSSHAARSANAALREEAQPPAMKGPCQGLGQQFCGFSALGTLRHKTRHS